MGCAYSIIYVTHSLVQVLECNNIVQAMNILEGLIPGEDAPKPADANHLSKLFVFSLMWSVGALLELDDRKKVFFTSMIRINPFVTYFLFIIYLFYLFVRSARKTQIAHKLSSAVFFFNSENCTPHPPLCRQTWRGHCSISPSPMNRPFPSFLGPLYQNEVNCSVFNTETIFHHMRIKLIFKREVVHSVSF